MELLERQPALTELTTLAAIGTALAAAVCAVLADRAWFARRQLVTQG